MSWRKATLEAGGSVKRLLRVIKARIDKAIPKYRKCQNITGYMNTICEQKDVEKKKYLFA